MPDLPGLVIADYHLDESTGLAAIERLSASCGRPLPALIITADRSADVQAAAQSRGYVLLNKPVRPAQLRAAMARALVGTGLEAAGAPAAST
jgi:CheY-like chemotaxis protein